MDLSDSFIVAGTATEQLYGMMEALYEPDLSPEDLFETMSQAFLNAVDRDAISGWGVVCYVMYYHFIFYTNKQYERTVHQEILKRADGLRWRIVQLFVFRCVLDPIVTVRSTLE